MTLNVFTRDLVTSKARPVIVFIHGGNFVRYEQKLQVSPITFSPFFLGTFVLKGTEMTHPFRRKDVVTRGLFISN